ncbi:peptidoglycan DD-metalloendopeptidase family protein [Actinomadura luteofluorescens]|uniref:peptidoglycan DD-metalloendopeptidase family protein n=1 Tax=Actinomadura luteofluorescens TaxID=46163 RepID=UPI00362A811C
MLHRGPRRPRARPRDPSPSGGSGPGTPSGPKGPGGRSSRTGPSGAAERRGASRRGARSSAASPRPARAVPARAPSGRAPGRSGRSPPNGAATPRASVSTRAAATTPRATPPARAGTPDRSAPTPEASGRPPERAAGRPHRAARRPHRAARRAGHAARHPDRASHPRAERDARTERPDARGKPRDDRTERFDARVEGLGGRAGRSARDRSREFPARGGRPRRAEPPRAGRDGSRRRPARPEQRRRQSPPRPGPKATPRRGRRPADRLSIGAIVLSTAVGLSLLGIAERALLDGGPVGGSSGPVGSQRAIRPPKPGTGGTPARPQQPQQRPGTGGGTAAPPAGPDLGVLATQVRKLTLAQRGAAARQAYGAALTRQPFVGATRQSADRTWVFGTSAIPVPESSAASPELAFYAAHWTGRQWQVGLSGATTFAALLGAAPANLMSPSESRLLRKYGALSAAQATTLVNGTRAGDRLMLPWKTGEAWSMTTSDDAASSRPLASLAFSGGDGRVLAAGAGRLYRFCSGQAGAVVMVIHPSGLASTYYGMRSVTELRDGSVVAQGDALGRTGAARPCGGAAAPGPEVAFGLRRGGGAVPLDGAEIGGWTFRERAKPLLGFAERGVLQVLPGGLLANLGPVPAADDPPSSSPSPGAKPKKDGAGSAGAPAQAAT